MEFRDTFSSLGCFSTHQVHVWDPGFDRNNFGRWEKQGKLIRLRQGYYALVLLKTMGDSPFYCANKIYAPSYISVHSALAFHGMIPEAVVQITSVTARKTAWFENQLGQFSYQTIKPELFFGYSIETSETHPTWSICMANPEKALLDLLYLNSYLKTEQDMLDLRLDEDFMHDTFNRERFQSYLVRFNSKSLHQRAAQVVGAYL